MGLALNKWMLFLKLELYWFDRAKNLLFMRLTLKDDWIFKFGLLLGFLLMAYCLLFIWGRVDSGFDITDESYYLLNASQPENLIGSVTNFGYLLKPLYLLVGEDVAFYRAAGVAILLCLAGILGYSILGYLVSNNILKNENGLDIIFYLAALSLVLGYYAQWWILTPSYNWLALSGSMMVVTGYIQLLSKNDKLDTNAQVFFYLAVGGCIAFVAKPTTAIYLIILGLVFFTLKKTSFVLWRRFLGAGVLSILLLLIFAVVSFGGVGAYIQNLDMGLKLGQLIDGGYARQQLISGVIASFARFFRWVLSLDYGKSSPAAYLLLLLWLISTLILILLKIINSVRPICSDFEKPFHVMGLSVFLMAAAFSTSIGTNNDLLKHISISMVFMGLSVALSFISLMMVFHLKIRGLMLIFLILSSGFVAYKLNYVSERPYRLPSAINEHNTPVTFLNPNQKLKLDTTTANYAKNLIALAEVGGWHRGTPLLDMTGASPGATFILDGRLLGVAWLTGGYKGSNTFATFVLHNTNKDLLKSAWILKAPEGRRRLSDDILQNGVGIDLTSYEVVGELVTGYRNEKQILYRPKSNPINNN